MTDDIQTDDIEEDEFDDEFVDGEEPDPLGSELVHNVGFSYDGLPHDELPYDELKQLLLDHGAADGNAIYEENRLSHEHFDQYESGRIELTDFFDWDDDDEIRCDEPGCPKYLGLTQAARELLHLIASHGEPRSRRELFDLATKFSRRLSVWIDPNLTESITIGGFDRLLVGFFGCNNHTIFVVELPSGWTIVSSRREVDELAEAHSDEDLSDDEDLVTEYRLTVDEHAFDTTTNLNQTQAKMNSQPTKFGYHDEHSDTDTERVVCGSRDLTILRGEELVGHVSKDTNSVELDSPMGDLGKWLQLVLQRTRLYDFEILNNLQDETFVWLTSHEVQLLQALAQQSESGDPDALEFSDDFYSELMFVLIAVERNMHQLAGVAAELEIVPIQLNLFEDLVRAL